MVLIYMSSITNHLFVCLSDTPVSSYVLLVLCLLLYFVHFSIGLFIILLICRNSLSVLYLLYLESCEYLLLLCNFSHFLYGVF